MFIYVLGKICPHCGRIAKEERLNNKKPAKAGFLLWRSQWDCRFASRFATLRALLTLFASPKSRIVRLFVEPGADSKIPHKEERLQIKKANASGICFFKWRYFPKLNHNAVLDTFEVVIASAPVISQNLKELEVFF